jgi:hypothetical protein
MFGYVRPVKEELKVREFEQFKACYCALCHTLGSKYGATARFVLNYDFTFLAMLLWKEGEAPVYTKKRCAASPCRKKTCCASADALDTCAAYSVILAWWKIRDTIEDESFFKSLRERFAALFVSGAYKKASREYPDFAEEVRASITELSALEKTKGKSLDGLADCFARITKAASSVIGDEAKRRMLEQLLYHTGRWIYILDACDDLTEDFKAGRYNPVAERFSITDGVLTPEAKGTLETTLTHSMNLTGAAFELMPHSAWTEISRNIIYLGMPEVLRRVLEGTWKKQRSRVPK